MFVLVLIWIGIGIFVGLCARGADLSSTFRVQQRYLLWRLLLIAVLSALIGGLVGVWFVGRTFATGLAIGCAVLGVWLLPWCWTFLQKRLASRMMWIIKIDK